MSVTFYVRDRQAVAYACAGLNVSNANAAALLRSLGIEPDECYCGSLDPADLIARIDTTPVDDTGTSDIAYRAEGGCTVVECGRRPGYWADRLGQLRRIAVAAQQVGAEVTYA